MHDEFIEQVRQFAEAVAKVAKANADIETLENARAILERCDQLQSEKE